MKARRRITPEPPPTPTLPVRRAGRRVVRIVRERPPCPYCESKNTRQYHTTFKAEPDCIGLSEWKCLYCGENFDVETEIRFAQTLGTWRKTPGSIAL